MQWFEVTPEGGAPWKVCAFTRDALVWEKAGRGRVVGQLADETTARLQDFYELAHIAARRQGLFHGTLAELEATCDVMLANPPKPEQDEVVDPTPPDHSPDG